MRSILKLGTPVHVLDSHVSDHPETSSTAESFQYWDGSSGKILESTVLLMPQKLSRPEYEARCLVQCSHGEIHEHHGKATRLVLCQFFERSILHICSVSYTTATNCRIIVLSRVYHEKVCHTYASIVYEDFGLQNWEYG